MMRGWMSIVLVGMGALSFADRIIDVPIGRSLKMGTFQISDLEGMNQSGSRDRYFAYAPLVGLEFGVRQRMRPNESGHATFDVAYNLVAPVAALSPGISVGVLDGLNETLDGRRTYVAFTFRELLDVGDKGANGEATMGIQFGHLNSGFVGVSLPLSNNLRFLVEHNGVRISTGFELAIDKSIRGRMITQDGTLLLGLNLSRRF
ncbi:MAG: hypothetical protein WCI55_01590 [Armatimonadota bacterium]